MYIYNFIFWLSVFFLFTAILLFKMNNKLNLKTPVVFASLYITLAIFINYTLYMHKVDATHITLPRNEINEVCGTNSSISTRFKLEGNHAYISCDSSDFLEATVKVNAYPDIVLKGLLSLTHEPAYLKKNKFQDADVKEVFADIYDLNPQDINLNKKSALIKAAEHSLKVNTN